MPDTNSGLPRIVPVIAAIAATGGFLFGYDTGVISGALLFLRDTFHLDPAAQGRVVSAVLVGAMAGAAVGGRLADFLGRRTTIILTALVFLCGTAVAGFAHTVETLLAGRVVLGLGIGVASLAVPLYISEISPPRLRGGLVSLNQLMITIGIVASYLVDELCSGLEHGWRWMFLAGGVPALILGVGMCFLPRSPRWLASQGKRKEAREVLHKLSVTDPEDMEQTLAVHAGGGSLRDLFAPDVFRVVGLGAALMFFQQATGINTVIYYAPTIFEMAGFETAGAAIWATAGVGVVNVAMTLVAIPLLDRLGRRPLLLTGLAGMGLALFALGLSFVWQESLGDSLRWAAVGSLFLYIASFAVSLGPIAWLLISEIYPLRIRGSAMSLATLTNWLCNCIVALTFLTIVDTLGKPGAFWLYAAMSLIGWLFCLFFAPETRGVRLETIESNLSAGRPLRRLGA